MLEASAAAKQTRQEERSMRIALCSCPSSRRQFSRCHRNTSSNVRDKVQQIRLHYGYIAYFSLLKQATDGRRPHQLLLIRHFDQKLRATLNDCLPARNKPNNVHLEAPILIVISPINLFWIIDGLAYECNAPMLLSLQMQYFKLYEL